MNKKFIQIITLVISIFAAQNQLNAQSFELDDIIDKKYAAKQVSLSQMMKDGKSYAAINEDATCILRYELKSGQLLDTIVNVKKTRECQMKNIEGFSFNDEETQILLWNESKAVYRRSFYAEHYVYNRHHNILMPLSENGAQRDACFSPDGRMVAFARDNNLFIKKLDFKTEVAVTKDGEINKIINGTSDWLYEEEFSTTRMYEWTADSKYLIYVRFNESHVKEYALTEYYCSMPENEDYQYYPGENRFKYPRAGQDNSRVSLHAYQVQYRQNTQLTLPVEKEDYIPYLKATKQANQMAVMTLNRNQNLFKMYYINPKSNINKLVLTESNEAYIDPSYLPEIEFTSKDFTYISEKDGYRHLYLYRNNGTLIKQITSGTDELINYYGRDTLKNVFYYQAVDELPYQRAIFASDIKGKQTRLSGKEKGIYKATFSPDFTCFIESYSRNDMAPCYRLKQAKGKTIRVMEDNAELNEKLKAMNLPAKKFCQFKSAAGDDLYAWMLLPAKFDENKAYPLLMVQYSGPNSQEVLDEYSFDWEYFLSQEDYVVVAVDGRGTGSRGEKFRKQTYMKLGEMESADQAAVARQLGELPYIDENRMAIWGWSYGGYISLISLMHEQPVFKAAISVAPVCDWRYYNTAYTERFMRRPQENPDGYDAFSAFRLLDHFSGKLLLVHGLSDDNVHPNQSMELIDAMVRKGIQFDMQLYPNRNHSILGSVYRKHLYHRWFDFLQNNL